MSYCMFSNTLADLRQCFERLGESNDPLSELTGDEQRAACKLILLCRTIADDYADDAEFWQTKSKS